MKFVSGWAFPDVDEFMVKELAADGSYQRPHLEAALRHVTDFSAAIDGGAHVGTWSRLMADRFGSVLAFEPSPDTFECLEHNLASVANVSRFPFALGAEPGAVSMTLDPANEARANTGGRHSIAGGDIPVITIDSLNLDRLGFLKLDIEGGEPLALQGAADTLRRCRPVVLFENKKLWTKHYGMPKNAVRDVLIPLGYQLREAIGGDEIWGYAE